MISVSAAHKEIILKRPLYKLSAYVYKYGKAPNANDVLGENKDFELLESDFFNTGNSICVESDVFPVGNAVCKTCKLTINSSTRYTAEDFAGAHLVLRIKAYYGGESFTVSGDYYFVQSVTKENGKIILECSDLMSLADKPYKYDVEFSTSAGYSTTKIYSLFTSVLSQMGVSYLTEPDITPDENGLINFANVCMNSTYSYNTHLRLQNSEYTCRQILGFIGMITASNIIAEAGALGIVANPLFYAKTVDGEAQYVFYGHDLNGYWMSFSDEAEEVKITGIECTTKKDVNGRDITPITYRSDTYTGKYVLDVSDNPFFQDGNGVNGLYDWLSVPVFRKFSGAFMGYPLIEYGDYVGVTHKGGVVKSFITDFEWNISGGVELGCNVESASENSTSFTGGPGAAVASNQDVLDNISETNVAGWNSAATKAEAINDYVVDQGTSGIWAWRKWNSGEAECWGIYAASGVNAAAHNYMGFYYSDILQVALPFSFTATPVVTVSGGGVNNMTLARTAPCTTTAAGVWILALDAAATSVSATVNIAVHGRWK